MSLREQRADFVADSKQSYGFADRDDSASAVGGRDDGGVPIERVFTGGNGYVTVVEGDGGDFY